MAVPNIGGLENTLVLYFYQQQLAQDVNILIGLIALWAVLIVLLRHVIKNKLIPKTIDKVILLVSFFFVPPIGPVIYLILKIILTKRTPAQQGLPIEGKTKGGNILIALIIVIAAFSIFQLAVGFVFTPNLNQMIRQTSGYFYSEGLDGFRVTEARYYSDGTYQFTIRNEMDIDAPILEISYEEPDFNIEEKIEYGPEPLVLRPGETNSVEFSAQPQITGSEYVGLIGISYQSSGTGTFSYVGGRISGYVG